ncbi:methylated-DNA--[protein]-cysteine S-methyltransferase [Salinimonas sp. HHU 13199]|uniref:Methylated-DNA--protein-cysteine methyltransferase n=2 Tax=Salinimonas profundi TaxID=2729140 RepID=A0ABR8LH84_9ALTE|nr:methylated-DNA--[protein]-cysteine S-methyltransferase [Salinimonas profundi]
MFQQTLTTPCGPLIISAGNRGITSVTFAEPEHDDHPGELTRQACRELSQYLAGEPVQFTVPLEVTGTPFQQRVWQALTAVPHGQTRTYGGIATMLNNPKAVRAVGAANGKNPVAIIVPCHRIIGANKKLTGYAGGLWRKQFLLELEGINDLCQ